jgi:hypothetical protein
MLGRTIPANHVPSRCGTSCLVLTLTINCRSLLGGCVGVCCLVVLGVCWALVWFVCGGEGEGVVPPDRVPGEALVSYDVLLTRQRQETK